jgi:dipeptidyl-peptidase-4
MLKPSLFLLALLPLTLSGCSAPPTAAGDRDQRSADGSRRQRVTLAKLYDPKQRVSFNGSPESGQVWLDDQHYLVPRKEGRRTEWKRVDAASGEVSSFGNVAAAKAAIEKIGAIKSEEAAQLAELNPARMNANRDALLFTIRKDLYVWLAKADKVVRLTNTPSAAEEHATFSPDGRRVAFVRDNDLYVCEVDPPAERRLTRDGSATILNGTLDWIYQEEIYGRGQFQSFWWSPDSENIAFLQLDQQGVPEWTLVDGVPMNPVIEKSRYPRPGEENPRVRVGLVPAARAEVRWVDLTRWSMDEPLVVDVAWLDASQLSFQVQNREQTWLDLCTVRVQETAPRVLLREESRAWVNANGSPRRLADGSLLWFSERSGWKHLYHLDAQGQLIAPVTRGNWEARTLHGVDEAGGWVYFSGTEKSHVETHVYRVRLDGTQLTRLSQAEGTHTVSFSPGLARYIDTWSNLWTPPQVRMHVADGTEERLIDANEVAALADHELAKPVLMEVRARDGFRLPAILMKPLDFDPRKRYPVVQHTYAGPHAPQVVNRWNGGAGLFGQLLAANGFVVWVCDNRSASGQGAVSEQVCYQRLGESELADIEEGLVWLKSQPWVDAARIGISGWSYGGFMASYSMTHSKSFRAGIAGGAVTDWRNYDSIYTERYMRLPKNNERGYEETSVVKSAKDLSGKLLLIHGAMDDNVHPANTEQLAYALQQENKPFELMYYGRQRHGITDERLLLHWRSLMLRFFQTELGAPK